MNTQSILSELARWSPLETAAAILALLYLILAARKSIWCWLYALISSGIYLYLCYDRQLYQQSLLQVFYLVMAVYGYLQWRRGTDSHERLAIGRWTARQHLQAAAAVLALTVLTGWAEARFTGAPMPYLDAFVTWGSVVTTWMVTRRVLENWLYWLIVDGVAVYLYFASALPATALLFVIYLGIVTAGYFNWRRSLQQVRA